MSKRPVLSRERATTPSGRPAAPGRGNVRQATDAYASMIAEATERGFYGTVALSLKVQDGAIEQVRVSTERVVR